MSELTKEKIYKKELIVKGAKGNNNLERIRSLGGTPRLQEKTAIPSITQQIIEADEEYNGLSSVFVEGVTSAIDNNIVAENIKKDVEILGVTGTYEGGGGTPTLISFGLFRPWASRGVLTRYPAETNMTWNNYVNSDYNTADLYVNENGKLAVNDTTIGLNTVITRYDETLGQDVEVLGTETIIANEYYNYETNGE